MNGTTAFTTTLAADSQNPGSMLDVAEEISGFAWGQITSSKQQWLIALVALTIGVVLIVSGKRAYRGLIVCFAGLMAAVTTTNFIGALWTLATFDFLRISLGVEVGLIVAYCTYKGIEGMELFLSAVLGFVLAMRLQGLLVLLHMSFLSTATGSHWVVASYYTLVVALLFFMFHKKGDDLLAVVSPVLGAPLVTSAFSWGLTELAVLVPATVSWLHGCSPVQGPWIDFLVMMMGIHGPDIGVFAGSPYNLPEASFNTDRLCAWVLGLTLTFIGWYLQRPSRRRRTTRTSARELVLPLLEAEQ